MQQTPAEQEQQLALRQARGAVIQSARARLDITQDEATARINRRLAASNQRAITRAQLSNIERALCRLREPLLKAIASALGIPAAHLRNPLIEAREAA